LARLDHPNLVDVTDFFEERGNAYLVMKLVEGENLAERIAQQGALPESEALTLADQLLEALAHCHNQGVIHRDVKPQNVIIRPDGRVVLVDFGLVKLWDPNDPHTKTAMRGMGTPEYAPPEQYDMGPGHHTDPRADIYGLGATLYHALTGQLPPTVTQRIASRSAFRPPRALNKRISPTVRSHAAAWDVLEMTVAEDHRC
jgi:serine/threonine protein kinase